MAEQWLSIVEYARTYQVSDMTVRRRIKNGRLHAVLKEGKYFIPVAVGEARASSEGRSDTERSPRVQPSASAPRRSTGEMAVIKGHPSAHSTYVSAYDPQKAAAGSSSAVRPAEATARFTDFGESEGESVVPSSLRRPLLSQDTSLVDTRALLAFCEASMRKLNEGERRTVEKFKSKLEVLEANLTTRDHEIKTLRQQVEDLQLLVKILEGKAR